MQTNTESLLFPITPVNPAGDNLEDEILFSEIRNARESDHEYLLQGEWSFSEPRKADWDKVSRLCSQSLMNESKDLQLACWFVESQGHLYGLTGLCSGVEFLNEFITRFWYQCWPSLEDDGIAVRRSKLVRLDREISQFIYCFRLLQKETTSLYHWQLIQNFEHKVNSNPGEREALILQEGDLTMASFDLQTAEFSSTEIRLQIERINHLLSIFKQLEERYYSLSQDKDGALFSLTRQKLLESENYLNRLLPHTTIRNEVENDLHSDKFDKDNIINNTNCSLSPISRELAINQMITIANWFRQSEPSSPVPFLIERAARWANMTLTEWLEEMLSDSKSIDDINIILTGKQK
ncbi:type VI secretion system protein TssA [Salmonella enterica]|nr:type VI secretion system protein TssA [Salmonella enterica]EEJ9029333.1 type VI secretion system protein TssA [Salmonella enterica subsp. enterica]